MTLEHALALFAVMPSADQHSVLRVINLDSSGLVFLQQIEAYGCQYTHDVVMRNNFVAAVSSKADEIERLMLAEQKTDGSA